MFVERAAEQRIFFVGDKQRLKREIAHGDTVILKAQGRSVLVRHVRMQDPHGFSGEVCGFEPPGVDEHCGVKVGDRVEFSERHVYSCSSGR